MSAGWAWSTSSQNMAPRVAVAGGDEPEQASDGAAGQGPERGPDSALPGRAIRRGEGLNSTEGSVDGPHQLLRDQQDEGDDSGALNSGTIIQGHTTLLPLELSVLGRRGAWSAG